MNGTAVLYALVLLMVTFWSGNYIAGKIALRELPPLLLMGLRMVFAGALMLPLYVMRRSRPRPSGAALRYLLLLGLFGVALNQLFFVVGLSRTSVAHAALINGLTPILVLLLAVMLGQERLTHRKMAGMGLALCGVAVLKSFEPSAGNTATWLGDGMVFLGGLSFAIFTVFGKQVSHLYSAVTVNTFAYAGGALALAPVTLWEASRHPLRNVSMAAWLAALYMAIFSSVLAYLIYGYALQRIAASRVSAASYLQPVFATSMGVAMLGEHVGAPVIAGGLVILSGVYLAERG